jgi:hypothetical protein
MTNATRLLSLLILSSILWATPIQAAELKPETLNAWNTAVEKLEHRISSEMASNQGFLSLDFQNAVEAAANRKRLMSGEIEVDQITSKSESIQVPSGMLHHWRGVVFIPGVNLDFVLSRVADPNREATRQEDVLDSRVLERQPGELRLYLKLQRSKIVTVVYNTEHLVRYRPQGSMRASSSSIATKIAEVDHARDGTEFEKPEGRDHGYLWRMNSYWRYQEVKGGVIVECESMTLSRSIPNLLEYMIRPIIKSVARESMKRTLESLRNRMVKANQNKGGLGNFG